MRPVMVKLPRPLWLTGFASLLVLLGLLGLSGSSGLRSVRTCTLLAPHESAQHQELFGFSRPIRSDELAVELPKSRAQQLAKPSFPLVNLNEGLGQLQRNSYGIPVLDWGIVFRPLLWPLLSGTRWGFGPRWFLRTVLVLLGMVGWFRAVTAREGSGTGRERTRLEITALGALAVLFSSSITWFQSTPIPEIVGFAGLGVAATRRSLLEHRRGPRFAWGISACYLFTCAFFGFYPPVWAPVLWLVAGTLVDCALGSRPREWRALARVVPLLAAVGVGVAVGIACYAPYLASVLHTSYPGARRVAGGGFPPARLLTVAWPSLGILGSPRGPEQYIGPSDAANVCEYASVEVIPLFALLVLTVVGGPVRRAVLRVMNDHPALLVAWGVLAAWLFVKLPEPFGTVALLRWSTGVRTWFAFDLGAALLAVAILTELGAAASRHWRLRWREVALAAVTCAALFVPVYPRYATRVPSDMSLRYWGPMALAALLIVLGVVWLRSRLGVILLGLGWALPLVVANHASRRPRMALPRFSGYGE